MTHGREDPSTDAEQRFSPARSARRSCPAVRRDCTMRLGDLRGAGLPTRRVEAWHYTDLRGLLRDAAAGLDAVRPSGAAPNATERRAGGIRTRLLDEFSVADYPASRALEGLRMQRLEDRARPTAASLRRVDRRSTTIRSLDLTPPWSRTASSSTCSRGVPLGGRSSFTSCAGARRAVTHLRILVVLGEGAQATLVETPAEGVGGFGDHRHSLLSRLGCRAPN